MTFINAVLNHFGDDGSCYSSCNGSAKEGFVSFCDGQYEIQADQIISKEEAKIIDRKLNYGAIHKCFTWILK